MKFKPSLLLLPLLYFIQFTLNQLNANIYLINSSSTTTTTTTTTTISLSNSELNAILSLKLNISQFERLPPSLYPNTPKAQLILGNPHDQDLPPPPSNSNLNSLNKLLILIYGTDAHNLLSTQSIQSSQSFTLPNPPDPLSFDGLISTYIGRLVDSLRLPIRSIFGVKDFIQAYHDSIGTDLLSNLPDWAQDWAGSLDRWIEWAHQELNHPNPTPNSQDHQDQQSSPEIKFHSFLKDYGPLDATAYQLMDDLTILDKFIETLDRPDSSPPPVSFLRLSSLQHIRNRHGEGSIQYRTGVTALKSYLTRILGHPSLITINGGSGIETILIGVPAQQTHSRLGKRTNLSILSPFKTFQHSFIKRDLLDRRRSVFGSSPSTTASKPIVPSSRTCFSTQAECKKRTESCHGHGQCVEGQKTYDSGAGKCFVCSCNKSKDSKTGKVSYWGGDRCEKEDISSGFVLLFGSALGLMILFGLAIRLLSSIGSQGLPQQLASVSGSSKKLD